MHTRSQALLDYAYSDFKYDCYKKWPDIAKPMIINPSAQPSNPSVSYNKALLEQYNRVNHQNIRLHLAHLQD